ncbi:hypothetical protein TrLO_g11274, partial [Triparma laevis f. longispina]
MVTPPTVMNTATPPTAIPSTSTLCMATTRTPAPRTEAMVKVREGLLDGTTWFEIDHTDSLILASTTGTWTEAIANLHKEERKGTKLWSTAVSSARIPNAATFDPALISKLMSAMKKATTAAASNSVDNYDTHRYFKSMVALRNLKEVAFTQFSADSSKGSGVSIPGPLLRGNLVHAPHSFKNIT